MSTLTYEEQQSYFNIFNVYEHVRHISAKEDIFDINHDFILYVRADSEFWRKCYDIRQNIDFRIAIQKTVHDFFIDIHEEVQCFNDSELFQI